MAIYNILKWPDQKLRTVATTVDNFNEDIHLISQNLLETMYKAHGIGLAATQCNIHKRIIVIDCSEDKTNPKILINPSIISQEGSETMEEGCLSLPSIREEVTRAEKITIKYQNLNGEFIEEKFNELEAVCIQHEIDHLNGKVFTDHISKIKAQRARKKLEKMQRLEEKIQQRK